MHLTAELCGDPDETSTHHQCHSLPPLRLLLLLIFVQLIYFSVDHSRLGQVAKDLPQKELHGIGGARFFTGRMTSCNSANNVSTLRI